MTNNSRRKIIGFDIETAPVPAICPNCEASIQPDKYNRSHIHVTDDLYKAMGKCPECDIGVLIPALSSDPDAHPPIFALDFAYLDGEAEVVHDTFTGYPGQAMNQEQLGEAIEYIHVHTMDGWTFAGANLVKFDFQHLAYASGAFDICVQAALRCIDPTFLSFCHQGYPIGLDACAKGIGVDGKLKTVIVDDQEIMVSGAGAWDLWCSGDAALREASIIYLEQDTDVSLWVGLHWARTSQQTWVSAKGRRMSKNLYKLTAEGAMKLGLPDTSWMKLAPGEVRPTREDYTGWMKDYTGWIKDYT